MSVFEYIKQVQNKPFVERKRIAIFGSVVGTLFIALLWLSTLLIKTGEGEAVANQANIDLSPLANLKATGLDVLHTLSSFKETFRTLEASGTTTGVLTATSTQVVATSSTATTTSTTSPSLLKAIEVLKKTSKKATSTKAVLKN